MARHPDAPSRCASLEPNRGSWPLHARSIIISYVHIHSSCLRASKEVHVFLQSGPDTSLARYAYHILSHARGDASTIMYHDPLLSQTHLVGVVNSFPCLPAALGLVESLHDPHAYRARQATLLFQCYRAGGLASRILAMQTLEFHPCSSSPSSLTPRLALPTGPSCILLSGG